MSKVSKEVDPSRERLLWRRFGSGRDSTAREELILLYLPMAHRIAGRYAAVSEPQDDLRQVASLGLVNAIDRFDPARGIPFLAFAMPTILGELKRHFRDKVWTVRVPRALHDLLAKIDRAVPQLTTEMQRSPRIDEIADRVGSSSEAVLEALAASENRRPMSIDRPMIETDGDESSVGEWLGEEEDGFRNVEYRLTVGSMAPGLRDFDREALRLRFIGDLTQSEIAGRLGCSQMHISRVLRRGLTAMREQAMSERAEEPHRGELGAIVARA